MDQDHRHRDAAVAKAARRLIPFLGLCYVVNFLDRVNVGFAALHMNEDLGFSPAVYGFGAGIFFVGYILFEIPSNLALQYFGARIWLARIMISWGIVACAMALVTGETSFYVLRLLLGIAEAGFFPGVILYLTYWFPAAERARIVALFMAAVPLATVVGGPVSGALLEMHGFLGLAGWHWLFIVEGLPAIVLGLVALAFLDDKPEQAAWLTTDERKSLADTLAAEAKTTREVGYADLGASLTRPRVLALGLLYFLIVIGLYGIGFWMPQVIASFGLAPLEVGFLTAIPYLFAAIAMVVWGRRSDRLSERRWHIALPLLLAASAFAWSAYAGPLLPTMIALTLATLGFYAALGPFWSLPTALLTGTGAAAGLALINSMGNTAGFAGPYIVGVLREATGNFSAALLFLAAALALGGLMALCFREPQATDRTNP
ncbi:MAG: MFS transporter [Methyloceanibacter sp.]|uniref:MFS transporter n=1 Tax=Methyloceanibacter sp. TaxID=1965321 RepID=UPI003D6D6FD8